MIYQTLRSRSKIAEHSGYSFNFAAISIPLQNCEQIYKLAIKLMRLYFIMGGLNGCSILNLIESLVKREAIKITDTCVESDENKRELMYSDDVQCDMHVAFEVTKENKIVILADGESIDGPPDGIEDFLDDEMFNTVIISGQDEYLKFKTPDGVFGGY